jgi:hypothetical protein
MPPNSMANRTRRNLPTPHPVRPPRRSPIAVKAPAPISATAPARRARRVKIVHRATSARHRNGLRKKSAPPSRRSSSALPLNPALGKTRPAKSARRKRMRQRSRKPLAPRAILMPSPHVRVAIRPRRSSRSAPPVTRRAVSLRRRAKASPTPNPPAPRGNLTRKPARSLPENRGQNPVPNPVRSPGKSRKGRNQPGSSRMVAPRSPARNPARLQGSNRTKPQARKARMRGPRGNPDLWHKKAPAMCRGFCFSGGADA